MGGFKKFLMRGNLIDMAIAVVVGVAFNTVIHALINYLIMPMIGVVGGVPDFANLSVKLNSSKVSYGLFLNAVLSFLVIAAVVYFLVVVPSNRAAELAAPDEQRTCPHCLSEIPAAATRCKFCTATVAPQVDGRSTQPAQAGAHRHRASWPPRG